MATDGTGRDSEILGTPRNQDSRQVARAGAGAVKREQRGRKRPHHFLLGGKTSSRKVKTRPEVCHGSSLNFLVILCGARHGVRVITSAASGDAQNDSELKRGRRARCERKLGQGAGVSPAVSHNASRSPQPRGSCLLRCRCWSGWT